MGERRSRAFQDAMRLTLAFLAGCSLIGLLSGCAAAVQERHFFATFNEGTDRKPREAVQFYRLEVRGNTQFSDARYLAGFYDERAVDLFFNELKGPKTAKLFEDNQKLPGASATTTTKPLNPDPSDGAFVLILSSNADSVANAIGSFAESQVVADALTRMLNKERYSAKLKSDASVAVIKAEANALWSQLEFHYKQASAASDGSSAVKSYLRALTTLAQGLGYRGGEFPSLARAQEWFALESTRSGGVR